MQIRHTPLSGGYCGEVPPLPIPNREVKLTCADGTAMQCGRVGSRLLLSKPQISKDFWGFFVFTRNFLFLTLIVFWVTQISQMTQIFFLAVFPISHRFHRCTQILDMFGLGWRRFFAAHKNMEKHLVKAKIALFYHLSVKILLKCELFLWIIWWVQFFVVLLHSLLRNQVLLLATKERVLWKILHKQTSSTRSG